MLYEFNNVKLHFHLWHKNYSSDIKILIDDGSNKGKMYKIH